MSGSGLDEPCCARRRPGELDALVGRQVRARDRDRSTDDTFVRADVQYAHVGARAGELGDRARERCHAGDRRRLERRVVDAARCRPCSWVGLRAVTCRGDGRRHDQTCHEHPERYEYEFLETDLPHHLFPLLYGFSVVVCRPVLGRLWSGRMACARDAGCVAPYWPARRRLVNRPEAGGTERAV